MKIATMSEIEKAASQNRGINDDDPLDRLVGNVRLHPGVVVRDVKGAPQRVWRPLSASLPRTSARHQYEGKKAEGRGLHSYPFHTLVDRVASGARRELKPVGRRP